MKALYGVFASANIQKMLPPDFQCYDSKDGELRSDANVSPWIISVLHHLSWSLLIIMFGLDATIAGQGI